MPDRDEPGWRSDDRAHSRRREGSPRRRFCEHRRVRSKPSRTAGSSGCRCCSPAGIIAYFALADEPEPRLAAALLLGASGSAWPPGMRRSACASAAHSLPSRRASPPPSCAPSWCERPCSRTSSVMSASRASSRPMSSATRAERRCARPARGRHGCAQIRERQSRLSAGDGGGLQRRQLAAGRRR